MGLLNSVVKPDELMPAAQNLAKTLAAKSREALASSKRDINAVFFGNRLF
jgi:enoyl-CoA hydratase/carnithine racemase